MKVTVVIVALATLPIATPIGAQWPDRPSPGIPRMPDGKVELSAPTPRTPDGKVDLSGIWTAELDPKGKPEGTEWEVKPRYFMDMTRYFDPEVFAMTPQAEALFKERFASQGKLSTEAHCVPVGVPAINNFHFPFKIIQTQQPLIVMLYEKDTMYRQIFMDGRGLPQDPDPRFMGYSVGRWEGDALVVESAGFIDKGFLDRLGHPYSDQLRLTERFRRGDFGHLSIEMSLVDPKYYEKPFTFTQTYRLLPDTELLEFVCQQNEKDTEHIK